MVAEAREAVKAVRNAECGSRNGRRGGERDAGRRGAWGQQLTLCLFLSSRSTLPPSTLPVTQASAILAAMDSPLSEPVTSVKGVGPAVAERLGKLGLATVRDLLWHFPRLYQDRSNLTPIAAARPGALEALCGTVREAKVAHWRRRGGVLTATIEDETGRIHAMWFGMPYLQKQLKPGTQLVLWGKVTLGKRGLTVLAPEFELVGDDEPLHAQRIVPIYPASAGIGQKRFRRILRAALDGFRDQAPDVIPDELSQQRHLIAIADALEQIHFPDDMKAAELARRRLVYEELFTLETAIALRKRGLQADVEGIAFDIPPKVDRRIRQRFPFRLTGAQSVPGHCRRVVGRYSAS